MYSQVPACLMFNATLILVIGGFRVMGRYLTIGMLIAYQGLVFNFSRPMSDLFNVLEKVQRLRGDLQRLDDVLNCSVDPLTTAPTPQNPDLSQKLSGAFELNGLRFAYSPQDKPLFDNLDFTAVAGERIGIIGASGSGKSTLARLVAGMYSPDAGEIRFDGKARSGYARAMLASSVAHVDQDIQFVEGTVRENLTLWDHSLTEAQIVSAAKDALIHDFIMAMPKGYDTPMQETAATCPAASASGSTSPARWPATRASCCSTNRPVPSTPPRRPASWTTAAGAAAPPSSSRTAASRCRPATA